MYRFTKEYQGENKYLKEAVLVHELGHWLDFTLNEKRGPTSEIKNTIFNQIAEVTQVYNDPYRAKLEERFADSIAAYYWCANYLNEKTGDLEKLYPKNPDMIANYNKYKPLMVELIIHLNKNFND